MLSPSQLSALNNAINNQKMLAYAKGHFTDEEILDIYKSYRIAKWSQMIPVIIEALFVIGVLIFMPPDNVPIGTSGPKEELILISAMVFIFIFPIWLVISNFTVSSKWSDYVKWYRENVDKSV